MLLGQADTLRFCSTDEGALVSGGRQGPISMHQRLTCDWAPEELCISAFTVQYPRKGCPCAPLRNRATRQYPSQRTKFVITETMIDKCPMRHFTAGVQRAARLSFDSREQNRLGPGPEELLPPPACAYLGAS